LFKLGITFGSDVWLIASETTKATP